jgi:hypothetical protein
MSIAFEAIAAAIAGVFCIGWMSASSPAFAKKPISRA